MEHLSEGTSASAGERYFIFLCRCFIYGLSMTQLVFTHTRGCTRAYKTKDTFKAFTWLPVPMYLKQWQECAGFLLTLFLVGMLCLEPINLCFPVNQEENMLGEYCLEYDNLRFPYTALAMSAMFMYFALLIDISVISTRISAFVLVCVRMVAEVALFLGAGFCCILTFSSGMSVLKADTAMTLQASNMVVTPFSECL